MHSAITWLAAGDRRRTVTTHLRKVYSRLGIGSRVRLTRWVVEHRKP